MYSIGQPQLGISPLIGNTATPLTLEEVERRRRLLADLGAGDGALGRANDWMGRQVGARDRALGSALRGAKSMASSL